MTKTSVRELSPAEPMDRAHAGKAQEALHPASKVAQHALIVLGPHRSGTSALTRVLSLCGAELPAHILRAEYGLPNDGNTQAGFWESRPLLDLHTEILESAGSKWDDPYDIPSPWFDSDLAKIFVERLAETLGTEFKDAPLFVAKDPRISRLAPIWDRALEKLGARAHWLIAVRNPLEVAASLGARDHISQTKGLLIWLSYFLAAERFTRQRNRHFVLYDDLLKDWRRVVATITDQLGIAFPRHGPRSAAEIGAFLNPRLRHHATPPEALDQADEIVLDWAKTAFRWAIAAAAGKPEPGEQLDALDQSLRQMESLYAPLLVEAERDAARLTQELDVLQKTKADVESQAIRELDQIRGRLAAREESLTKFEAGLADLQRVVERQQLDHRGALLDQERSLARAREELEDRLAQREESLARTAAELADLQRLVEQPQLDDSVSLSDHKQDLVRIQKGLESRLADREESLAKIAVELANLQRVVERQQLDHRTALLDHEQDLARAREELTRLRRFFEQQRTDRNPRVKTLAFYLPQYHPIPENDRWWGKGFTEWANVSTAEPCFDGHEQPMLPSELGFYDLRIPKVRSQQAALAREHGIYGFCYYYYWFDGKKLLEHPLEEIIASGEPNFPFCICWANENWTRRWDGQDDHILQAQNHSLESDARFIADVLPILRDPRYIKKDGKPLLLVYRADLLADAKATAEAWRKAAREAGLPGLHLCTVWRVKDPLKLDFDARVEFPPHHVLNKNITSQKKGIADDFSGKILDYAAAVDAVRVEENDEFPIYRGVMPGWDNTPRLGKNATIFSGGTPELYRKWLEMVLSESASRPGDDDQFVFINAWNEWAEGAALEPSRLYGRKYLEATRSAVRKTVEFEKLAELRTDLKRLEGRIDKRSAESERAMLALTDERHSKLRSLDERVEAKLAKNRFVLGGLRKSVEELGSKLTGQRAALKKLTASIEGQDGEHVGLAWQLRSLAHHVAEIRRVTLARQVGRAPHGLWLSPHYGVLGLFLKSPIWLLLGRLTSRLRWWRQARRILRAGLFDPGYYLERYPEVAASGVDPLYHYVRCGAAERRDPNSFFDTDRYLARYPEAAATDVNPLLHYLSFGSWEADAGAGNREADAVVEGLETAAQGEGAVLAAGASAGAEEPAPSAKTAPVEWQLNQDQLAKRDTATTALLFVSHDVYRAGAQIYLLEVIKSFAQHPEYEIYVLTCGGGELRADFERYAHLLGVHEHAGPLESVVVDAVDAMHRPPGAALCNSVASGSVAQILRGLDLPVVSIVHELPTTIEALGTRNIYDTVDASQTVIVVSEFVKRALVKRYSLPADRLQVIHVGVTGWNPEAERRDAGRRRVLAAYGLPDDAHLVLGCGSIHPRKGPDLFVQVARNAIVHHELDNTYFLWVGDEQLVGFRAWCEHDLAGFGVQDRVIFTGPQASTVDFYLAADVFLLTSREDPFPLVNLEALARGLPIVAFADSGGATEALVDEAGIVVPYLDTREMTRALVRLIEAPRYRAEVSRRALARAHERYRWDRFIGKLQELLSHYVVPREAKPRTSSTP